MAGSFQVEVSDRTVEVTSTVTPLRMAVVSRTNAKNLGDRWENSGIYVLLGAPADNTWRVYVGQAMRLRARIRQHRKSAEDGMFVWNRALLVCRTHPEFGLSEIGWLEGRIHRLLEEDGVELENKQKPGDAPLGPVRSADLEIFVEVIQDALVLLGYDPEGHQQQVPAQKAELEPEEIKPTTTGTHRVLLDVVHAGTQIESMVPSHSATATVDAKGIRYQGKLFGSLTAAAKAVTGYRTSGWSFWGVRSDTGAVVRLGDMQSKRKTGGARVAGETRSAHGQRPTATKRDRTRPHSDAGGTTTPKMMSAATVRRFLARRDAGATHAQLQEEFRLKKGSVARLLKENDRVRER